MSGGIYRSV